jgi:glycosyltransferase involved in cell wall biosynthesis
MHLLSIIIPTQNRNTQCIAAVEAILAFPHDFELIIFDSGTGDVLETLLQQVEDSRLHYVRATAAMNMTQCFEAAIIQGTGRFVCMIGDDDAVTPALFEWADKAAADDLSSVTVDPAYYVLYNWPDIRSIYFGAAASGKLFTRLGNSGYMRMLDATELIGNFLAGSGQGCGVLPRVYHGIIARNVLDQMKSRFGRCFDGVSPDVSFSYFAALCSTRHCIINTPLTISGASAVSNAGRSAMMLHKGDLWSDPHMRNYQDEPWPHEVPEFFSVETVWGQATLGAVKRVDPGDFSRFNFPHFYALLLLRHPDRWRTTWRSAQASQRAGPVALSAAIATQALRLGLGNFVKLWRKAVPDRSRQVMTCASLVEASAITATKIGTQCV